jgi:hypothetical protein
MESLHQEWWFVYSSMAVSVQSRGSDWTNSDARPNQASKITAIIAELPERDGI